MIMNRKTCHLLPILREGGWEWAFQGRHGIYLDPTHPTNLDEPPFESSQLIAEEIGRENRAQM